MKKIIILFSIACISLSAAAQRAVRIGSYEVIVRSQGQDTTLQVNVLDDPCPPCPSENETRPAPQRPRYNRTQSTAWGGFGFIIPDNGEGYYTTLGGNSINLDFGGMKRWHLSRWFALGWTYNYSFYNYKLKDVDQEMTFNTEVLGGNIFDKKDINKQVFRSHNFAIGVFTRFYLIPPPAREKLYIDIGAQGDIAPFRHYMMKFVNGGKDFYPNDYAFNSFSTSAVARIGWKNHAFFLRYRLTENFNQNALPKDLPPINFGIIWLN